MDPFDAKDREEVNLFHRVQGHPGQGVQRGNAPLPAGGLAVERCLKE
ncbi:hypothetical protein VT03_22705 [Planctomyces sp. SH-PL14]|nr:hypothetical protein VT03_22705 [Planctomyces sp. SH-PL14]